MFKVQRIKIVSVLHREFVLKDVVEVDVVDLNVPTSYPRCDRTIPEQKKSLILSFASLAPRYERLFEIIEVEQLLVEGGVARVARVRYKLGVIVNDCCSKIKHVE